MNPLDLHLNRHLLLHLNLLHLNHQRVRVRVGGEEALCATGAQPCGCENVREYQANHLPTTNHWSGGWHSGITVQRSVGFTRFVHATPRRNKLPQRNPSYRPVHTIVRTSYVVRSEGTLRQPKFMPNPFPISEIKAFPKASLANPPKSKLAQLIPHPSVPTQLKTTSDLSSSDPKLHFRHSTLSRTTNPSCSKIYRKIFKNWF